MPSDAGHQPLHGQEPRHLEGEHDGGHDHTGGVLHEVAGQRHGLRAVWLSAGGLAVTALVQLLIVRVSGSAGLFADALHNVGDVAATASLWLAFQVSRRGVSDEFPYGWGRAEDLAGLLIVTAIVASGVAAGWHSLSALVASSHQVEHPGWALAAALLGAVGNEAVAVYRIRVGRQIGSVALVADGQHARTDGWVSAAAAVGILGAWLGFSLADPLAGLVITAVIAWVAVRTGREVLRRAMDAVEPDLVPRVRRIADGVEGVVGVHEVRGRYLGRGLHLQLHADVDPDLPLRAAHGIAEELRHQLLHAIPSLTTVDVHVDPAGDHQAHARTRHHFHHG